MTVIGIREIRQNASKYLRRVRAGETIQIVDRGHPVALWVPAPEVGGIARLEAEGRLTDSQGDLLDLGPPLEARRGTSPLSEALEESRKHER
jgi:prevent-host-death family protein